MGEGKSVIMAGRLWEQRTLCSHGAARDLCGEN